MISKVIKVHLSAVLSLSDSTWLSVTTECCYTCIVWSCNSVFLRQANNIATGDAMRAMVDWYHNNDEAHPLIKSALFCYEFVSIHPFQDGNNGWLIVDPYLNYKPKTFKVNRIALIKDELKALSEKETPMKRLKLVKDIFLFSCYTGLAYVDVNKLKRSGVLRELMVKAGYTNWKKPIRYPGFFCFLPDPKLRNDTRETGNANAMTGYCRY